MPQNQAIVSQKCRNSQFKIFCLLTDLASGPSGELNIEISIDILTNIPHTYPYACPLWFRYIPTIQTGLQIREKCDFQGFLKLDFSSLNRL